jgi:hypothetical protein
MASIVRYTAASERGREGGLKDLRVRCLMRY